MRRVVRNKSKGTAQKMKGTAQKIMKGTAQKIMKGTAQKIVKGTAQKKKGTAQKIIEGSTHKLKGTAQKMKGIAQKNVMGTVLNYERRQHTASKSQHSDYMMRMILRTIVIGLILTLLALPHTTAAIVGGSEHSLACVGRFPNVFITLAEGGNAEAQALLSATGELSGLRTSVKVKDEEIARCLNTITENGQEKISLESSVSELESKLKRMTTKLEEQTLKASNKGVMPTPDKYETWGGNYQHIQFFYNANDRSADHPGVSLDSLISSVTVPGFTMFVVDGKKLYEVEVHGKTVPGSEWDCPAVDLVQRLFTEMCQPLFYAKNFDMIEKMKKAAKDICLIKRQMMIRGERIWNGQIFFYVARSAVLGVERNCSHRYECAPVVVPMRSRLQTAVLRMAAMLLAYAFSLYGVLIALHHQCVRDTPVYIPLHLTSTAELYYLPPLIQEAMAIPIVRVQ
jgi:hypothetical protein